MLDVIKCAVRNLTRKKARTFLTILSITVGVASVVLISTVSTVGAFTVSSEIDSLGLGALTVSANATSSGKIALTTEHLSALQSQPEVEEAVPVLVEKGKVEMRKLSADGMIWGIDSGAKQIFNLDLKYGRLLRKEDVLKKNPVCLVDETMANAFYHRNNIVGKQLKLLLGGRYVSFEIVGVVASGGNILQSFIGDYVPSFVYVPYSSMQDALGQYSFDQIALKVDDSVDVSAFSSHVLQVLEEQEGRSGLFNTQNIAQQKDKLNNIMQIVTQILSIIAGISMVVAGLGIMTVMLASVSERTREIGIKKSIGASKGIIIREFLFESLALSVLGSLSGVGIGLTVAWIGCTVAKIPFLISGSTILFTICFAVVNGLIFGVYPSIKAANLNPVEALRHDM